MRHGGEDRLNPLTSHDAVNVYGEMLLQVTRDYPGIPDPRTLTVSEIRFFYNGLRSELMASTQPKG